MMASGFDILESLDKQPVAMPDAAKAMAFLKLNGQEGPTRLKAKDENLTVHWNRGTLFVNAAKGKGLGGQYYLDEGLQETAGAEFVSSGNSMKLKVNDEAQALAVLDYILEEGGWPLYAFEQRQLARDLLGIETPQLEQVAPPVVKPVEVREQEGQQLALGVEVEEVEASAPLPVVEGREAISPPSINPAQTIAPLPVAEVLDAQPISKPIAPPAVVEVQGAIAPPQIPPPQIPPPPVPEKVEAKPSLDPQGLNSAQAYQLEQLAFEHPEPGTGAADLKEEIRDRLTMGGGTPAQVMAQIDQELDAKEDPQIAQSSGPELQPTPEGYSPTLQEMRDWLTDAKINQRPPNYLKRIRELSVEFLADTPLAELPVAQRDPEARNPGFVLSEAAQTAMAHDRAASEQRRTPTRQMLLSWYSAARALGQSAQHLAQIQQLGQQQVAGTPEAQKPPHQRNLTFINPEFQLTRQEIEQARKTMLLAEARQTKNRSREQREAA